MGAYLLLGVLLLGIFLLLARGFIQANPSRVAQFLRAFIAAFSALASTGLLYAGRFGLALIAIGAMIMALRAMRSAPAGGFSGFGGSGGGTSSSDGRSSQVETDTLIMQLDHTTGALEGEVRRGGFAGRSLDSLGLSDLLDLLAECQREDPRSVALLETYLDRREPDWRAHVTGAEAGAEGDDEAGEGQRSAPSSGGMDEAKACSILGLSAGASVEEIKAAHRRLMTKLHPDHGGSSYLAAELNQAKEYLLRRRR